ncbi:MAG: amino acid permease [Candidatus Aenigmatarchaeota archaeon]
MKLRRELGLIEVVFYGISVIVGAGIFVLIGEGAKLAGNSLWVSFLIAALISIFTGFSYAELSAMYPKSGAEFVYVKKAYGSDFWAFLIGWLLIFALTSGMAAVSLGFSGYLTNLLGIENDVMRISISISLLVFLSLINFYGIKETSRVNMILISVVFVSLIFIIFSGLSKTNNFSRFFEAPHGLSGVFSAVTLVFFAYLGFENVAYLAEETKKPSHNIPMALILSIIITAMLYSLVSISALNLADWKELARSSAPLAFAISKVFGEMAFLFISIAALVATSSTCLGLSVASSRLIYGMAKENSLPRFISAIHSKRRTPYLAIAISTILAVYFIFSGKIDRVAKLTSLNSLLAFTAVNLSLIYLRYTKPEMERPFKSPINIGNFPITAFLGAVSCISLLGFFDADLLSLTFSILVIGWLLFFIKKQILKG